MFSYFRTVFAFFIHVYKNSRHFLIQSLLEFLKLLYFVFTTYLYIRVFCSNSSQAPYKAPQKSMSTPYKYGKNMKKFMKWKL